MEQKRNIQSSSVIIVVAFVFVIGVLIGSLVEPLKPFINSAAQNFGQTVSGANQDFSLYWEVYNKLQGNYVDQAKLDKDQLYYGSIKGMVNAIGDPATAYFDPTETADYNKSRGGEYEGIGAELDMVNNQVVIVSPFEGSPAKLAGLEAGDIITKVDGTSVLDLTLNETVSKIRGKGGTQVKITVARPRLNNKPFEFTITRGQISAPSMTFKDVKDGVAEVKINRFTEQSLGEWESKWDAIATDLQSKAAKGEVKSILIDLRGNPGGFFDAAVYLAGDFLPKGSVISYQRDRNSKDDSFPTDRSPRLEKVPVVILVNGSSASASEIFSGAMQYYKRATLIGEKTYGKGTAQIVLPVSGGGSLHVTISKWLLPDKRWINHDSPIIPDKEVKFDYDAKAQGQDNQLDAAQKEAKSKQ